MACAAPICCDGAMSWSPSVFQALTSMGGQPWMDCMSPAVMDCVSWAGVNCDMVKKLWSKSTSSAQVCVA